MADTANKLEKEKEAEDDDGTKEAATKTGPFVASDISKIISHEVSNRYLGRYLLKCELKNGHVVSIESKDFKQQSLSAKIFTAYAKEASDNQFASFVKMEAALRKDPRLQGRLKTRYKIDNGDWENMTEDLNYRFKQGLSGEFIASRVWDHARSGRGSGVDWEVCSIELSVFFLCLMRMCVFFVMYKYSVITLS